MSDFWIPVYVTVWYVVKLCVYVLFSTFFIIYLLFFFISEYFDFMLSLRENECEGLSI